MLGSSKENIPAGKILSVVTILLSSVAIFHGGKVILTFATGPVEPAAFFVVGIIIVIIIVVAVVSISIAVFVVLSFLFFEFQGVAIRFVVRSALAGPDDDGDEYGQDAGCDPRGCPGILEVDQDVFKV
jgi:hypothetical protein